MTAQRTARPNAGGPEELSVLMRRHSTATVLFHNAMAERLGLGASDHKCLDLMLQHKDMTGSRLAAITGLTTGAITGVVNRLEKANYIRRCPDPADGRRQRLEPVPERIAEVAALFIENGPSLDDLVAEMDADQIATVIGFISRATQDLEQRSTTLRAAALRNYRQE
jgi:DNA-binding MarR family transcriptional regulator